MLSLCIDTSYKYLSCCLIENGKIIASHDEICFKKQSEKVFTILESLFLDANKNFLDVDSVCIAKGPGSYTGVRIAMTIAKVLCSIQELELYTISTLRLYASGQENTLVVMDARAGRAYYGIYDKEIVVHEDSVDYLDNICVGDLNIVGDGSILGHSDFMPIVSEAFLSCIGFWEKIENIDHLTPSYLKESDTYTR